MDDYEKTILVHVLYLEQITGIQNCTRDQYRIQEFNVLLYIYP